MTNVQSVHCCFNSNSLRQNSRFYLVINVITLKTAIVYRVHHTVLSGFKLDCCSVLNIISVVNPIAVRLNDFMIF